MRDQLLIYSKMESFTTLSLKHISPPAFAVGKKEFMSVGLQNMLVYEKLYIIIFMSGEGCADICWQFYIPE